MNKGRNKRRNKWKALILLKRIKRKRKMGFLMTITKMRVKTKMMKEELGSGKKIKMISNFKERLRIVVIIYFFILLQKNIR